MRIIVGLSLFFCCQLMPLSTSAQDMTTPITVDAINAASLLNAFVVDERAYIFEPQQTVAEEIAAEAEAAPKAPDPAIVRAQVLLDQFGASPGVIDGYDGENLRKGVMAYQAMLGLPPTGDLDAASVERLETGQPVMGLYTITQEDVADITGPTPADYAEKAQLSFLGYASVAEKLSEYFHMDIDLLVALNPGATFTAGETIVAAVTGVNRTGVVTRLVADKTLRQLLAYDGQGMLIAAYPATIGSEDNPSPSGSYVVEVVAPMPNYTYNPAINFQQGENTEVLTIPPGPNGPVGSMWIALSKPTYGIHGTPEPAMIDKTGSHGCVRLTNWDAEELAGMVSAGVTVDFI